jgi:hypothetical protein
MKVIVKSIENQFGQTDECHVAEWGELNLKNGTARLRLFSYASKEAYEAGKPSTTNRDVNLSFADIVNFKPLWTELATKLLSDPASQFVGGTLDDAEKPL